MRRPIQICIAAVLIELVVSAISVAGTIEFRPTTMDAPKYPTTFVDDRRWDVEVLGTGLADVTHRHVAMGGVTVGVGYYVLQNLAIQLDVSGYGFNEGHVNGPAAGVTIGLRHHVLSVGKSSIFFDISFGEIWADHDLPVHGTHRNNTFEFGVGVSYPIGDNVYLIGGPRFFHLSNANDGGSDRNPSINAVQGVLGVMWKF